MSENERRAHEEMLRSTGRFQVTREEREATINAMIGDLDLTLQEDIESTLELPQLRIK